ncbi:NAD(P)/FAD-dependent oxidoreductase [Oculatella sp. LEGE 06141]|uniref:NAD(P)/FAD-dependent oxidoreductase n=1 Tax=Oculatella sp. LEGE 06141 TaxID=1828648 RepID=UPI001881F997|nr:NAD(P)/FAD-dependent oxidoreductase [Oculatella sp. LEGE 06141]MBE9182706.1 NAD(P)/FAD-dependent oxidoreductase [Oculatella sp. LEGE 06141]
MATPIYQTVILGGGFAGLFTALHLSHQHYPRTVILIDQNDRFCFKPLLYEYFSGEMEAEQVIPRYDELLHHSGVIFVQGSVESIDLQERQIQLVGGDCYGYSNLVLALGSVTGYFGVEGASDHALPFRTQEDAIAIDRHLRDRLQQAVQLQDQESRRRLLTTVVVGGGPSGVEMAATLADFLPHWYAELGGKVEDVRVILVNHGELLEGDVNSQLRATAVQAFQQRTVPVEVIIGAKVTTIQPNSLKYERNGQTETLDAGTVIWTTGTNTHPLIKSLPIPDEHQDKHGRLSVTSTLQLPDFPEVFAGGDCAMDLQPGDAYEPAEHASNPSTTAESRHPNPKPLPPTAQVAYQQGAAIAYNLRALALGYALKPANVNLRGTLLKLGLNNSAANVFNALEVTGEIGHLIRQGTYLELLPTPVHNFKATTEWLKDEVIERYHPSGLKQAVKAAGVVGSVLIGAVIARRVARSLADDR